MGITIAKSAADIDSKQINYKMQTRWFWERVAAGRRRCFPSQDLVASFCIQAFLPGDEACHSGGCLND